MALAEIVRRQGEMGCSTGLHYNIKFDDRNLKKWGA
jgi:hypothetical protein